MLFDRVGELPVATVRRAPGSPVELLASDLKRWIAARWRWFKPRTIPVAVAFVGMLGVIESMNQLSQPPAETAATVAVHLVLDR
jgi:hypothetical protein